MKSILFAIIFLFPTFLTAEPKFNWKIQDEVYKVVPFISHEIPKPYGQYLIMNVNFAPVKKLFSSLDKYLAGALNKKAARTEAHITVITPPEFDSVLSKVLTIKDINKLALEMKIQSFDFKVMCVGRASFKKDSTYFLVVRSRKLQDLRKRIFDLYKKKGGEPSQFDPNLFYPHITIGYTNKDLHLGPHGVKKGINSCWGKVSQ